MKYLQEIIKKNKIWIIIYIILGIGLSFWRITALPDEGTDAG